MENTFVDAWQSTAYFTATAVPTNQPVDNAYKLSTIAAISELGVPDRDIKRIGGRNPKFRQRIFRYRLVARQVPY
jgi:hypothetical protein